MKFGKNNMSKVGKLPVELPSGVTVEINGSEVVVKGPKGTLTKTFPTSLEVKLDDKSVRVLAKKQNKMTRALHGTYRALLANMVKGVNDGWEKVLEIVGTGYRAEVQGKKLVLTVGYSHPVEFEAPEGIEFKVEKLLITISGCDKELVGQMAALVRKARPPEPYKGKGIKYQDEYVRRKAGKAAKTEAA